MGVEVDVQRRDDLLVVRVLVLGELVGEVVRVVVVDERDGADGLGVAGLPLVLDERAADEVAQRLGAVDVGLLGDELVEAVEQALVDRDAEADEVGHGASPFAIAACHATASGWHASCHPAAKWHHPALLTPVAGWPTVRAYSSTTLQSVAPQHARSPRPAHREDPPRAHGRRAHLPRRRRRHVGRDRRRRRLQRAQGAQRPGREQDPADGRRRRLRLRRADAQLRHPRHRLERPPRRRADAGDPVGAGGRLPRDGLDPRRPGAVLRRRRAARARLPTSSTSGFFPAFVAYPLVYRRIVGDGPELARGRVFTGTLLAADRRPAARRARRRARDDRLRRHRAAVLDLPAAHAADPPGDRRRRGAGDGGRGALRATGRSPSCWRATATRRVAARACASGRSIIGLRRGGAGRRRRALVVRVDEPRRSGVVHRQGHGLCGGAADELLGTRGGRRPAGPHRAPAGLRPGCGGHGGGARRRGGRAGVAGGRRRHQSLRPRRRRRRRRRGRPHRRSCSTVAPRAGGLARPADGRERSPRVQAGVGRASNG